jgi:hypothetical protein
MHYFGHLCSHMSVSEKTKTAEVEVIFIHNRIKYANKHNIYVIYIKLIY